MTDREKRTTISVGKLMLARVKMHAAAFRTPAASAAFGCRARSSNLDPITLESKHAETL